VIGRSRRDLLAGFVDDPAQRVVVEVLADPGEIVHRVDAQRIQLGARTTPDRSSSRGESTAPAETMTSLRAVAVVDCPPLSYSTPLHVVPSNSSRRARESVETVRLLRSSTGCR
jgi:hypothetical protein